MAEWAAQEEWTVHTFTDETEPIRFGQINKVLTTLPDSTAQLLIYFAGQGEREADDMWILSGTDFQNQVINASQTVERARKSGIPSIAVFSDACRTAVGNSRLDLHDIAGTIFRRSTNDKRGDVDTFFATTDGQAAYEEKTNNASA